MAETRRAARALDTIHRMYKAFAPDKPPFDALVALSAEVFAYSVHMPKDREGKFTVTGDASVIVYVHEPSGSLYQIEGGLMVPVTIVIL